MIVTFLTDIFTYISSSMLKKIVANDKEPLVSVSSRKHEFQHFHLDVILSAVAVHLNIWCILSLSAIRMMFLNIILAVYISVGIVV